VNINGSGRGAVGTDLNAIPAFAIDKLKYIRDGASTVVWLRCNQGVINIKKKSN
jgi:iron complex outermembrane receptor protein